MTKILWGRVAALGVCLLLTVFFAMYALTCALTAGPSWDWPDLHVTPPARVYPPAAKMLLDCNLNVFASFA